MSIIKNVIEVGDQVEFLVDKVSENSLIEKGTKLTVVGIEEDTNPWVYLEDGSGFKTQELAKNIIRSKHLFQLIKAEKILVEPELQYLAD